jgi:hypothetical protein
MPRKILPRPTGALVCKRCLLVYATVTDDEPITILGEVYEPEHPLERCSKCSRRLEVLGEGSFSELCLYRHRGGKNGY